MKKIGQVGGNQFLYRCIISIITGLLLIAYPESALKYVVYIIGIFTVLMGVMTMVSLNKHKNDFDSSQRSMMKVNYVINIILGLLLIAAPTFFISFLMKIIGVFIIIAALVQFYMLYQRKTQNMPVPFTLYLMPLLILVLGCIVTFYSFPTASLVVKIIGYTIVFYGIFELVLQLKIKNSKN